jgi:hypothetical protein
MAYYYDICSGELTGESGFEHLEECLPFLPFQQMASRYQREEGG